MRFGMIGLGEDERFALLESDHAYWEPSVSMLPASIDEALATLARELRDRLAGVSLGDLQRGAIGEDVALLPPIGSAQEVWASGVTYERSREARTVEATEPSVYDRVYEAERPELFFKALPQRVVGPGGEVAIRSDSTWDVPEPELVLVVNARAEIVGYTLGNDMTSRSIEGENPLYLPQAKVYERSCAIGPVILPTWEVERPHDMTLTLRIEREGRLVFAGDTSIASMRRSLESLVEYLFRSLSFPHGVLLFTGTGVVPPETFTLAPGDVVRIACDRIGELENVVTVV